MLNQLDKKSKQDLRILCSDLRKSIMHKQDKDNSICKSLLESCLYDDARQILCYAALNDEINCDSIIMSALSDGKLVALPRCENKNGDMSFYYISCMDDVEIGHYGIREPKPHCPKVSNYENSIVIVPGYAFDKYGNRVGYGKGYYDKFLQNYAFISIGLCYNTFVVEKIDCDRLDIPVNYIFTDSRILECEKGE